MYKHVLFFTPILFFLIMYSCKGKVKSVDKEIKCEINSIQLDYVLRKRDWCRFSIIYLNGTIINNTEKKQIVKIGVLDDFCDFDRKGIFNLNIDNNYVNAINIEKNVESIMNPKDSLKFKLRVQLQHVYENDKYYYRFPELLQRNEIIGFVKKDSTNVSITKSKDLKYTYTIDDKEYDNSEEFFAFYKEQSRILPDVSRIITIDSIN